jgi:biotin carboxylase
VLAAADKARQRECWAAAGVAQPRFEIVPAQATEDDCRQASNATGFACVVKAVSLSASQGVLRADDPLEAVLAAARIRRLLAEVRRPSGRPRRVPAHRTAARRPSRC